MIRPATLMLLLLVTACGSGENVRRRTVEDRTPADQQAAPPDQEYVPKPEAEGDERPWASAFVNYTFETVGIRGTGDGRALSWLAWGVPLQRPAVGAVAVLDYGQGRGHVGFVEGTYGGMIVLLGGDQQNQVGTTAFAAGDIKAYRWPAGPPIAASAYHLPPVRPQGAREEDGGPPREAGTGGAGAAADPGATDSADVYSLAGKQTLRVQRTADDRIRFRLVAHSCQRSVAGGAYEIYPGDAQIDAENGIGYPAREYFFWADSSGTRGLSVRLSLGEPRRARVTEWGYATQCPYSDAVMHGAGRRAQSERSR